MFSKKPNIPNKTKIEQEYEAKRSLYEKILYDLQLRLMENMKNIPLYPSIKTRVKSFESYYNKLLKRLKEFENKDIAYAITDILALRIICPFLENLNTVELLIKNNYNTIEADYKGADYTFKEFGYVAIHHLIDIPSDIRLQYQIKKELYCEIQICTILQDAWAEVEHELVYKNNEFSPFEESLKRKLAAINANLTLADILFQEILDYQKKLKLRLKIRRETFFEKVEMESLPFKMNSETETNNYIPSDIAFIIDKDSNKIDELLLIALDAHNTKQFSKAVNFYSQILELVIPLNIQVIIFIHRGMAYFAMSDYQNSLSDFSSAIDIDSNNHRAFYLRGIVYMVLENYQSALIDLNSSIELEPYKFTPYFNRAQVYFHINDYPKALSDCEQALKIKPESPQARKLKEIIISRMDMFNG